MENLKVKVVGLTPLLMANPNSMLVEGLHKLPPEKLVEHLTYRGKNGNLIVPSEALYRALIFGGAFTKGKGGRSLSDMVAGCVQVSPLDLDLGTKKFTIDTRTAVNQLKGRIWVHRPRIDEWSFTTIITYDSDLIKEEQMKKILRDTGLMVGLLSFRPKKKGPFGRFRPEFVN